MKCEVLCHGKWKWNVMILLLEMESGVKQHAQVLGKELAISSKMEKKSKCKQAKHKNKHMPLAKDSNMSTRKPLQHANSNLECG